MQLTIEFNDAHLQRVLKAVEREIATPQEMLGSLGETLLNANKDRHANELSPDGKTKWAPLKESSKQDKRRGGVLNKTGQMVDSLNYQIQGDNTLVLGFDGKRNDDLATWHHFGTDAYLIEPLTKKALKFGNTIVKKVNHPGLPARPLLGFEPNDQRLVLDVLDDHLTKVLRGAGAKG